MSVSLLLILSLSLSQVAFQSLINTTKIFTVDINNTFQLHCTIQIKLQCPDPVSSCIIYVMTWMIISSIFAQTQSLIE